MVSFLTYIQEVINSNLDRDTIYPESFRGLLLFHKANAGTVPQIGQRPVPSASFSIHYSLITTEPELLPASLNTLQRSNKPMGKKNSDTALYRFSFSSDAISLQYENSRECYVIRTRKTN
jgi:hypothetical protein